MKEKNFDKDFAAANDIAIVGMAFRFPGNVVDEASFWQLLEQGKCGVSEIPASRWPTDLYQDSLKTTPGRSITFRAGVINDVLSFEPAFFGISPRETEWMDPQQRLLLKLVYECFEDAGIRPDDVRGTRCGVFSGISASDYMFRSGKDPASISAYTMTGNAACISANRISYIFDLEGPSFSLDTACSSGMTAIHEACESIRRGESVSAIAAGVHLFFEPGPFIGFSKASMLSPNGRCLPFDDRGDGYVRSEGGAVLYLKKLSDAMKDGNRIHAVIRASGINTDGARKSGITVPSARAQADLMKQVLEKAGIAPEDLDFVEAHGTGTPVGDPIEADSISSVYGLSHQGPLPITSVKANLGHMEPVSGFAGLIKAVLALKHHFIPRVPFDYQPSSHIDFKALNIFCPKDGLVLEPRNGSLPLMASVNSFGFGGANAHVVLSEAPCTGSGIPRNSLPGTVKTAEIPEAAPESAASGSNPLSGQELPPFILTAFSRDSLKTMAVSYADFIGSFPEESALRGYLNTCNAVINTREVMNNRILVSGSSVSEIRDSLLMFAEGLDLSNVVSCDTADKKCQKTAFVFSGNGSQYAGMGVSLYRDNSLFRKTADRISDIAEPLLGYAIRDYLSGKVPVTAENILDASVSQPLIFAVEAGIFEILKDRGFEPDGVIGHSMGEITCSYATGKLSLDDAVRTIAVRSILQNRTRGMGGMAAASLSSQDFEKVVRDLGIQDEISMAAINSPANITVTGSHEGLKILGEYCSKNRVFFKKLKVDYPFHSKAMDLIKGDIEEQLRDIVPLKSDIEFYSTVTGDLYDRDIDSAYWGSNVRESVLFESAMSAMLRNGYDCFIEIAPTPVLQRYLRENVKEAGKTSSARISSVLLQGMDGDSRLQSFIMEHTLYQGAGFWDLRLRKYIREMNASGFGYEPEHTDLPHYKWTEKQYAVKPTAEMSPVQRRISPLLGWRLNTADPVFDNILEPHKSSLLSSHKVDGECVFAAADFIEAALEAHAAVYDEEIVNLEYLDIRSSMVFEPDICRAMELSVNLSNGAFSVKSREYAKDEAWNVHSCGRMVSGLSLPELPASNPEKNGAALADIGEIRACTREDVYKTAVSLGLEYGPEFSLIAEAVPDPETATLEVRLVSDIPDRKKYIVHPGIMDAALQALLVTGRSDTSGRLYLPVGFGRISFRRGEDIAAVTVIPGACSSRSISADFIFRTADGTVAGVIKGAELRAFPKVRTASSEGASVPLWHYTLKEAPSRTRNGVFGTDMSFEAVNGRSSPEALAHRSRWYEERYPVLEALTMICALRAVSESRLSRADFEKHPLGRYLCSVLTEKGLLDESGRPAPAGENLLRENTEGYVQDLISGDGFSLRPLLNAFRSGENLDEALSEDAESPAVDNGGTPDSIFEMLRDTECPAELQGEEVLVRELSECLFRRYQDNYPGDAESRPLVRVLEIGAGSGSQSLPGNILQELFGDRVLLVHAAFVSSSAGSGREPCFDTAEAQLRYDLQDPGIPESYDLVVMHRGLSGSGTGVMRVLDGIRKILAPGGLLVSLERYPVFYADLVSGRNRSWWQYSNGTPVSPLKTPSFWERVLKDAHYDNVSVLSDAATGEISAGPYFMVAERGNAEALQYSDDNSGNGSCRGSIRISLPWASGEFSERLESSDGFRLLKSLSAVSGFETDILDAGFAGDPLAAFSSSSDDIGSANPRCQKYVFLSPCGLKTLCTEPDPGEIPLAEILNALTVFSEKLAEVSARDKKRNRTELLVVTQNVLNAPAESAIAGLARVIRNELPGLNIRSITLQGDFCPDLGDPTFEGLCDEILNGTGPDEVVLSGSGRYRPVLEEKISAPGTSGVSSAASEESGTASAAETRYLDFTEAGRLKNLSWKTRKLGEPGPKDLRIKVAASGLNFRDVMMTMGLVPDEVLRNGFSGPFLGLEFSGTVMEIGSEVTEFSIGDRVFGLGSATISEMIDVPVYAVSALPDNWSFGEGAGVSVVFFTAWYALHTLAGLEKGERLFVHGAAGGVGIAAIQIAKHLGLEVYATAGSREKRDFLKLMGVRHIYNSRTLAFHDEVLRDTDGEGVDAVLNCLSGEAMLESLSILRPFGRFIELGKRDYVENTGIGIRPLRENVSYFAVDVDQLFRFRPEKARRIMEELGAFFRSGDSGTAVMRPLPYTVFPASGVIDAFKLMQQGGHIGKIVISMEDFSENKVPEKSMAVKEPSARNPVTREVFSKESTWLVTGGTRGFGFETACFLASLGAGRLVLVSRTGTLTPECADKVRELTENGTEVMTRSCNVADRDEVRGMLAELRTAGIRLTGIIHAAAVFRDAFLGDMSASRYAEVLDPKYQGALNLHLETLDDNLSCFVMYSSVSVAIGNIGQANYVAANSALEGLCALRRSSGLHAACVEWGPIGDAGYLTANAGVMKSLERSGGAMALRAQDALKMLPDIILEGGVQVVASMDWKRTVSSLDAVPGRLHALSLRLSDTMADQNSGAGLRDRLLGLSREEAVKLIIEVLSSEAAETLGLSVQDIGPDRNLHELGLDSLMAMDLVVGLEKKLGTRISVMLFQDRPSVRVLADRLYGKITGTGDSSEDDESRQDSAAKAMFSLHLTEQDSEVMADKGL